MNVELLSPRKEKNIEIETLFESLQSAERLDGLDDKIVDFLQAFSKEVLQYSQKDKQGDLAALGFWCRKANIKRIINDFNDNQTYPIVSRGIALHIAPSNVDTIFIYSWVCSLLVGNKNIIRLSQKSNPTTDKICETLCTLFKEDLFSEIAKSNLIITYPHNQEITAYLSKNVDCRAIWGGDQTINQMRGIPTSPACRDIVFRDRQSLSLIKADHYLEMNDDDKKVFIEKFYNDAYWFDQMACSSPRVIYYLHPEKKTAQECHRSMMVDLQNYIQSKNYQVSAGTFLDKLSRGFRDIATGEVTALNQFSPELISLSMDKRSSSDNHVGGGLFRYYHIKSTDELVNQINNKDQSMSYLGLEEQEIVHLIKKLQGRGIDRIIPVGQALQFDVNWEGLNLLSEFSKKVFWN